jgi:hypothetical protein
MQGEISSSIAGMMMMMMMMMPHLHTLSLSALAQKLLQLCAVIHSTLAVLTVVAITV